jgi:hypothetical protein
MAEIDDKLLKAERLAGEAQDPFSVGYGPTPYCFSANDIVRMYRLGAQKSDVDHIQTCDACSVRVQRFAEVMGQRAHAEVPAQQPRDWWRRLGWGSPAVPAAAHALLHVPTAWSVVGTRLGEPVRVQLVAGSIRHCSNVTVRVAGAVAGEVTNWSPGKEQFPTIELHDVKVSHDVLDALRNNYRVVQRVVVAFGDSAERPAVTATANVEFTRGSAA